MLKRGSLSVRLQVPVLTVTVVQYHCLHLTARLEHINRTEVVDPVTAKALK